MSKPISVRLDSATHAALSAYARRLGVSPGVAMRYFTRRALGQGADAAGFQEGYTAGLAAFRRSLKRIADEEPSR